MSGEDIKLLSDFFVKLNYMTANNIMKNSSGIVECNEAMIKAAREYQADKGFTIEDKITSATALALKTDSANYRKLGSRIITAGTTGTDVSEFKNLLIDLGVIKGKKKAKYDETQFDETIAEMLEAYLTENGVEWAGKVDSRVVTYLKGVLND